MRNFILTLVSLLSWLYRIIPKYLRRKAVFGLLLLESRAGKADDALRQLYLIRDDMDQLLSERAMAYEGGEHPKHRLTQYHDFFVTNILPDSEVADIGCGYGVVARTIARSVPGVKVTGVEMDKRRYDQALASNNPENLRFHFGDALKTLPEGNFDVVVLSNVLEHIEPRVSFLRRVRENLGPGKILIRVPHFNRDWHIPMRKELGITYFSDPAHYIEHTVPEFEAEINAAGLKVESLQTVWGEIWAICRSDVSSFEKKESPNAG